MKELEKHGLPINIILRKARQLGSMHWINGKSYQLKLDDYMIVYRLTGHRFVSLYCSDVPERSVTLEFDFVSIGTG